MPDHNDSDPKVATRQYVDEVGRAAGSYGLWAITAPPQIHDPDPTWLDPIQNALAFVRRGLRPSTLGVIEDGGEVSHLYPRVRRAWEPGEYA